MTDWTLIAGGRCSKRTWRVGVAGFVPEMRQVFLLSDADWLDLSQELPLQQLAVYCQSNGLQFERIKDVQSLDWDGLLLITYARSEQPLFDPPEQLRRYLLLRQEVERAELADETVFNKVFLPVKIPNLDERLVYIDAPLTDPACQNSDQWTIAKQPDERDYSLQYHRSADFWIHRLTSAIAADAARALGIEPLISIIIPTYNYGRFLRQCVQSVLDQGVDDIEILVLDNASTDDTTDVMAAFAANPRVRYIRNRYNYGGGYNWRNGLWIAQGRYFTFLSADDYFNPGHLSRLLPVLVKHPEMAVGYTGIRWVDDQGKEQRQPRHPGYRDADYAGGRNEVADLLIFDCYMTPSAVIYKRDAFCKTWDPHKTYGAGDWEMVVQMAERYPDFAYSNVPGVSYRWHPAQESNKFYASSEPLEAHLTIVEGVFNRDAQQRIRGQEREVAAHIERRLALFPDEFATPLGARARRLIERLKALAEFNEAPMFSIVVTTYNRPRLLRDTLTSIEQQSLRDFEVILVNDHGDPVEVLLSDFDFPITYINQARNRGPAAARNAALRLARGHYIAFLDDDDCFLPSHLQALASAIESNPGYVVYSNSVYITEKIDGDKRVELARERRYSHGDYSIERLFVDNYIPINTFACPRDIALSTGGFDEALNGLEDWDFLMHIAAKAPFHHVQRETVQVRMRVRDLKPGRRSELALKNYPMLYRELYARHASLDDEQVKSQRNAKLAHLDQLLDKRNESRVQTWLAARVPNPLQKRLIEARVESSGGRPRICVVVLDMRGDADAISQSLVSLWSEQQRYRSFEVSVLSVGDFGADAFADDIVTKVAQDDYVATLNQTIAASDCDWCMVVQAGERFTASGLLIAALELITEPNSRAIYGDEVQVTSAGELLPILRPDFNLDLLLSFPASMGRHWLFRCDVFAAAGGFDPLFSHVLEFELVLRLIELDGLVGLGHFSEPLLVTAALQLQHNDAEVRAIERHLKNRGYADSKVAPYLPGRYRLNYGHADKPGVSIIVPAFAPMATFQRCVESILEMTRDVAFELLLLPRRGQGIEMTAWLDSLVAMGDANLRVLSECADKRLCAAQNHAAQQARGDYLLFVAADCAIIKDDWLQLMLNHAQRPEIGAVGVKIVTPSGQVLHAGIVLGLQGPASSPFIGETLSASGYMNRLEIDQNYTAVSGACMMVSREKFLGCDGLDETDVAEKWADIDMCIRFLQAGYLNVWTPHVSVMKDRADDPLTTIEQDAFYSRWLPILARDPAYNQNLSLVQPGGFKLADNALSWRPTSSWKPLPTILAHPGDMFGCGHYRVLYPLWAMQADGMVEGAHSIGLMHPTDLERYEPDAIVLQRQIEVERIEAMRRIHAFSNAFKVYELDDYLPNLPIKSLHREHMPKDIVRSLRQGLSFVDRFVVSTQPLAEAFKGFHPDIVVVPNRLPPEMWGQLGRTSAGGARMRVGWAGGASHAGDLAMIADVVKELANEVDWIFFGMCPDSLRPFIKEWHQGVNIEQYASTLAALDLDLAIAPLEANMFNSCKSNLKVLEYGACGYPVVCTDIEPYRGALPITKVRNKFSDWVDAIRSHISDRDASARMGLELQTVVRRDWLLQGEALNRWLDAWAGR